MRLPVVVFSAGLLLACTPVVSQRGYLPDPIGEASIKIGTDTKTTVQDRLGDPSTEATFGGDAWYYISSVEKQISFFDPRVENRSILALYFDKDGKITNIRHYSLKDGHVVAFETHETPAKGRELTFLQQLLNATPGVPIGAPGGQGQGNGPPNGGYP
ncbi:MAG TPA: outer membrane protein assembly factor BamE [Rhizomicrobium sp.]|nr:outer membrane protein assembly factor BamE [Rhizomicrobium sp.]